MLQHLPRRASARTNGKHREQEPFRPIRSRRQLLGARAPRRANGSTATLPVVRCARRASGRAGDSAWSRGAGASATRSDHRRRRAERLRGARASLRVPALPSGHHGRLSRPAREEALHGHGDRRRAVDVVGLAADRSRGPQSNLSRRRVRRQSAGALDDPATLGPSCARRRALGEGRGRRGLVVAALRRASSPVRVVAR